MNFKKIRAIIKYLEGQNLRPDCIYCRIPLEICEVQGSRGLRVDNLKKWEDSGVDVKQLPNTEWHRESYMSYYWECDKCRHREEIMPETKTILISDGGIK